MSFASWFGGLFGGSSGAPTAATPAPFVPTFETPLGIGPNGYRNKFQNPAYYATAETAEWVRQQVGAAKVVEVSPAESGTGGPYHFVVDGAAGGPPWTLLWQRAVRWGDGSQANAGQAADVYAGGIRDGMTVEWSLQAMRDHCELARREQR